MPPWPGHLSCEGEARSLCGGAEEPAAPPPVHLRGGCSHRDRSCLALAPCGCGSHCVIYRRLHGLVGNVHPSREVSSLGLVHAARRRAHEQLPELMQRQDLASSGRMHKSPFQQTWQTYAVGTWGLVVLLLITVNKVEEAL
eukprot:scaffold2140_cov394-Prasinococcus_capsulatus_cf.AAC.17